MELSKEKAKEELSPRRYTHYSKELKLQVVNEYLQGARLCDLIRKYSLNGYTTIMPWIHIFASKPIKQVKMDESDSNPISPYNLIFKHKKNTLELNASSNVFFIYVVRQNLCMSITLSILDNKPYCLSTSSTLHSCMFEDKTKPSSGLIFEDLRSFIFLL